MDEEENFARLLSQSTTAAAPQWSAPEADPWANPFSDAPSSNPYAPAQPAAFNVPSFSAPPSPVNEVSPYVQKIQEDARSPPDPPSVIAAREQEHIDSSAGYSEPSPYSPPRQSGPGFSQQGQQGHVASPRKGLPSDLIDEELLAASDPSASLKKAFVKSTPPTKARDAVSEAGGKPKQYVFTPGRKEKDVKPAQAAKAVKPEPAAEAKDGEEQEVTAKAADAPEDVPVTVAIDSGVTKEGETPAAELAEDQAELTPTNSRPTAIPLPESTDGTPTTTRPASPLQTLAQETSEASEAAEPSPAALATPTTDRVAVSPLDPPPNESDYGFQSLAIGGSSIDPPAPPPKSPATEVTNGGWSAPKAISPPGSRFGGRGWGALDDEDSSGLFGKGGPSTRTADPWGATDDNESEGGWGEPGVASLSTPGPSQPAVEATPPPNRITTPPDTAASASAASPTVRTPRTPKLLSKPLFQIAIGDPTRMGDPVRGYTVYTVRTKTTSPHYRKGEFSVLRRFSDFLWLFETLTYNNPGVIVPPVPDKHPFGRFQDTFIETRRLALQRCLTKVTSHPVLQLDPDLRLFLESDHFAVESKSRRAELTQEKSGLLSGWTGPKFTEQDEWFDNRRAFLDSLESQLKALSKSIESASKSRLDMAVGMGDFASSMTALADSDLGSAMCAALARLSDLAHREKEANEEQAKAEVVHLLNLSDEYVRFIGSVRLAFASRIRCYERWQAMEKDVLRLRQLREKARQQGKLGDRANQSLAEVGTAERRSRDASAEFEAVTKLVKGEFGRFERERVDEFKHVLERFLDGQIIRQKDLIEAWEEYHAVVLKMVQKSQGPNAPQAAVAA